VSIRRTLTAALPASPFFHTPAQRVALARQRFFDDGQRPSGLVGEQTIQSWTRCLGAGLRPGDVPQIDAISRSKQQTAQARSRALLEAARPELDGLEAAIARTRCKALLLDASGLVVSATPSTQDDGRVLHLACRTGFDLSEGYMGTNAPGVAASTGLPCTVLGEEHFFQITREMHCTAAPIHDRHGRLAGVLDLSIQGAPFGFDAAALVSVSATLIENRLMCAQSTGHLLLRFHTLPGMLETPLAGLAAIDGDGRIAWVNRAGRSLLGLPATFTAAGSPPEAVFGVSARVLEQLIGRLAPMQLPSGLTLHMGAVQQTPAPGARHRRADPGTGPTAGSRTVSAPGRTSATNVVAAALPTTPNLHPDADVSEAAPAVPGPSDETALPAPGSPSLRDASLQHIEAVLAACGGNVSQAARQLRVSRGLLYRRLKAMNARTPGGPSG